MIGDCIDEAPPARGISVPGMKTESIASRRPLASPSSTPIRSVQVSAIVIVAVLAGGCGNVTPDSTNSVPAGTYRLIQVNDHPLPYTVPHEGRMPTIQSGKFTFAADGSCLSQVRFSLPQGGETERTVRATYTRRGAEFILKWEGAGVNTGTLNSNTFTMNNEGMIFRYVK